MDRHIGWAALAILLLVAIPNPFAPRQQAVQKDDPREGWILNPDSSGWHEYARNHAEKRCGLYFFHEGSSLRFVFSRFDTTRKSVVAELALAESAAVEMRKGPPTAIVTGPRKYIIRVDSVPSCLKQPPP